MRHVEGGIYIVIIRARTNIVNIVRQVLGMG